MKTLHTWQCPEHGVLHSFPSNSEDGTDVNATAIAVKAVGDMFVRGCTEIVRDARGERKHCGEKVTHMAGLK